MADIESARTIFEQFDVDGDGFVTAAELRQVLAEVGGTDVPEATAQALIDANDGNGDGLLSFEEFWAARQAAGNS